MTSSGRSSPQAASETKARRAPSPTVSNRIVHGFRLRRLLASADALAVAGALALATVVVSPGVPVPGQFEMAVLTLPGWILVFKAYGLYDRDGKRVSHSTVDDIPRIFHALVIGGLGLWLFMRLDVARKLTLEQGAVFIFSAFALVLLARGVARRVARVSIPPQRVLFVGGGLMAGVLTAKIRQHPEYRLEPVGYVDASESPTLGRQIPYLGHVNTVQEVAVDYGIDRLVIASPSVKEAQLEEIVRTARGLDISISILPQMVDVLGPAVEVDDVEGITVLGLNPPALTPSSRALKRGMDVVLATPALLVTLPFMLAIAVLVRLDTPGPILFSQERIGRHGRRFRIYKFRTMVIDADEHTDQLRSQSEHPVWLLLAQDPRVTRVGRFLRQTSLDELPQLWNVIRGHMSLVGPRPMPPDVDEQISGWGRTRLDLTPGITGLWQVLGRTSIPFEEMVKLDYLYVTNWTLWQDVRLMIHTLPAVVKRRGVN